jgi:hypothetical protein
MALQQPMEQQPTKHNNYNLKNSWLHQQTFTVKHTSHEITYSGFGKAVELHNAIVIEEILNVSRLYRRSSQVYLKVAFLHIELTTVIVDRAKHAQHSYGHSTMPFLDRNVEDL